VATARRRRTVVSREDAEGHNAFDHAGRDRSRLRIEKNTAVPCERASRCEYNVTYWVTGWIVRVSSSGVPVRMGIGADFFVHWRTPLTRAQTDGNRLGYRR
jgi:hypothetical protein